MAGLLAERMGSLPAAEVEVPLEQELAAVRAKQLEATCRRFLSTFLTSSMRGAN
jgi:hypothetical protein